MMGHRQYPHLRSLGRERRYAATPCLNCGKDLDACEQINGDGGPRPGNITVCLYCGHVMVFDEKMKFRDLNDAEMVEVAGDPRLVEMGRLVGEVIEKRKRDLLHGIATPPRRRNT